jgi:hypothetical protein
MMRLAAVPSLLLALFASVPLVGQAPSKTLVFWQAGFPTIASVPETQAALTKALGAVTFADEKALDDPATLSGAELLVLPYGSAVPADDWTSIQKFLSSGGSLLVLGGQALRVPVVYQDGTFVQERPQDSYSRVLGMRHTYEVPVGADAVFHWKRGYAEGAPPRVKATRFFAEEGWLDGLGYMVANDGQLVAAPVIFSNRTGSGAGGRVVALDFEPAPGYWESEDGVALVRRAAEYASQGAETFSIETQFSTVRPGETPLLAVHVRRSKDAAVTGEVKVELTRDGKRVEAMTLPLSGAGDSIALPFRAGLPAGFYEVSATWLDNSHIREAAQNGFWVSPPDELKGGPVLGANADTLTLNGKPFLPVGTNYFGTEQSGWDFSGPRNAVNWEHDFADMQAHGVSFVRTGVWMPNARFIDGDLGGVTERFLRNVEAFLLSAQRHKIAVNFTFFAFSPKWGNPRPDESGAAPPNPYLDPQGLRAQEDYVRSVVTRFKDVPFLSWDLINEPSVSNPKQVFKGNYPNDDPAERKAWHAWLKNHYASINALADAWSTTPEELGSFDAVPVPSIGDLTYDRYGNPRQVRALDYNLYSQEVFRGWVKAMLGTIHTVGSRQIVDVGQDEGGVTNRVLNHFYADTGLSFTTNHTYWEDDSLLWDSVAAKVPGVPNITGETGYQPAWAADGTWRYDEFTGLSLMERKWALGFAAGSSGAMQWDWAKEFDFGMERSDGSAKVWEQMMRELGQFARDAAPYAVALREPETAIVLPQSLQLSVLNGYALEAQQTAVRALYQAARGEAYTVGEYQMGKMGTPKLILLPSPMGLTEEAWTALKGAVRGGATLLVTGPFDADAHLHGTDRAKAIGLDYQEVPLELRDERVKWPGGDDTFSFAGKKTTVLMRAHMADGSDWKEVSLGKGKVLFSALPLELSGNLDGLGKVYSYAMKQAHVDPLYTTSETNPGILICPTEYENATLYVLTSETETKTVSFHDVRSGKDFSTKLDAGRAALVMIGTDGKVLAEYRWATQ